MTADPDHVLSTVYAEEFASVYGAIIAALTGDHEGVTTMFDTLTPDQAKATAVAALISMAETCRQALPPNTIAAMVRGVREVAAEHARNYR